MNTQIELIPTQFPREIYQFGQRSDGERHGVVLTKPHVVDLMLDLSGFRDGPGVISKRILEPSCGHGAFLSRILERVLSSVRISDIDISQFKNSITAFDIDPENIAITKKSLFNILTLKGFTHVDAKALVDCWVLEKDFLLADLPSWFDLIVGNPPYIRIEQIPTSLQVEYRKRFISLYDRADLYVAFIEQSLSLLSENGLLSFICADRWILNRYGGPLRKKIANDFHLHTYIDLHHAAPFESDVIAYPSIFVIGKKPRKTIDVLRLRSVNPEDCSKVISAIKTQDGCQAPVYHASYDAWFKDDEPWVLSAPDQFRALRQLERDFGLLESDDTTKVRIGVATGNDKIYLIDKSLPIEKSRLLPLVMRADLKGGEITDSGKCVINTYEDTGQIVDLENYPKLRMYFENNLEGIRKRHIAKKNEVGWFRTIDRVYPALAKRPKLLVPDIAGSIEICYDAGNFYPHHNLYFIISDTWDLEVLGGLLSSKVALFFVWSYAVKMRGGYLRFQAQYLRRIRVPRQEDLSDQLKKNIKRAFNNRDFSSLDQLAMQAYNLNHLPEFDFVDTRH